MIMHIIFAGSRGDPINKGERPNSNADMSKIFRFDFENTQYRRPPIPNSPDREKRQGRESCVREDERTPRTRKNKQKSSLIGRRIKRGAG